MPDFMPDKPELLAEVYNAIALILGQVHFTYYSRKMYTVLI
jgi:hypothetical protein